MKKLYDLAVKTGSYVNNSGDNKNSYANIGVIMENDDGSRMIFIKRSFNPAGVPFKEGSESIIVSMFKPKVKDETTPPPEQNIPDGEIPF